MSAAVLFVTGAGAGMLAGVTTCGVLHTGLLAGVVREGGSPARHVGEFLAAKLVVHTLLGALLGLVGRAVRPSAEVRGVLLVVSGLLVLYFALDFLGVPVRRRRSCEEPSRLRSAWLVGAATVFVPCGLTVSAELLAVASGSAVQGAAVMAGFVLGTAPVTGVLGLSAGLLRGRLARVLGVALLVVAGWTVVGGVRLGGWLDGQGPPQAIDARFVAQAPGGGQTITVHALDRGYRPALLAARAGVPTVLVLRTDGTRGCTRAFEIPDRGVSLLLPEKGELRVDLGVPRAGRLRFVCAAGHYPGAITFR
ncbi:sulfite exporter TauE/SafE family protein [Actinocorallia sp. A-T 12471]|uniref:urease accessory protein UreH domain-containing protein n=1 Tax=Actinocorallia sp. A-T 12471 TaxID=3089813 RepID=UPI0029CB1D64|nr:sulfite exporter TauE/SafE family protein [Actinocorallia sp. A-T 12471]MDX6744768.1 sulfite exporter TauE/SafE family protein [Actinocorallia sp. A-T 12471]